MNNEQVTPIINTLVAAIVTAVVTSDAFKGAVADIVLKESTATNYDSDEFKDAVHAIINEEDSLIMFDNDKFKEAVDERIQKYDFDDIIKDVVSNMSFSVEVSRY